MKKTILTAVLGLFLVTLFSCNKPDDSPGPGAPKQEELIGTWKFLELKGRFYKNESFLGEALVYDSTHKFITLEFTETEIIQKERDAGDNYLEESVFSYEHHPGKQKVLLVTDMDSTIEWTYHFTNGRLQISYTENIPLDEEEDEYNRVEAFLLFRKI